MVRAAACFDARAKEDVLPTLAAFAALEGCFLAFGALGAAANRKGQPCREHHAVLV